MNADNGTVAHPALHSPELAAAETAHRRRWKRFVRWELYGIGLLGLAWAGWIAWGILT